MRIPFNKPFIPWQSFRYLIRVVFSGTIAGNGLYTKKCHGFFEKRFGYTKVLLTTSCSDALEMSALLCGIVPGDEVIMTSFNFMSAANAFLLRGARIVFADTLPDMPNINPDGVENLITQKTKVIVVTHYGGVACDMDRIMEIARRNGLLVVEDAAHAIDSFYHGRALGAIGHFGTFSFHETKNIISGEGGLLIVNDRKFVKRAEIIWEKGTTRAAFYRGEIVKYDWVDTGSSYLPADTIAAFLFAQTVCFDKIQTKRKNIWWNYHELLQPLEEKGYLKRPLVPDYATVNGNLFFITLTTRKQRDDLLGFLMTRGITALYHYQPLHSSLFFLEKHDGRELPNTDRFSATLIRLPFYNSLRKSQIKYIVRKINEFFEKN